ncbi:hypothetical protein LCGC14_2131110, partial [marine sediment metagenome]
MLLEQDSYSDEDGKTIAAHEIEAIGTFKYSSDGFFEWECPHCKERESTRAFKINGTVFRCPGCKKRALLLRSDASYVGGVIANNIEQERGTDRVIRDALEHMGRVISCLG